MQYFVNVLSDPSINLITVDLFGSDFIILPNNSIFEVYL